MLHETMSSCLRAVFVCVLASCCAQAQDPVNPQTEDSRSDNSVTEITGGNDWDNLATDIDADSEFDSSDRSALENSNTSVVENEPVDPDEIDEEFTSESRGFGNPFKNTPFDPSTYPGAANDVLKGGKQLLNDSQGNTSYQVKLENRTPYTIYAAVIGRWTVGQTSWKQGRSDGWYRIAPGGTAYTPKSYKGWLYFYAETDNKLHSNRRVWKGNRTETFKGRKLPFHAPEIKWRPDGVYTYTFR